MDTFTELESNNGSSVAEQAVNGACLADQNVVPMAPTTGFVVGDALCIDNTTTANSEYGRIKVVTVALLSVWWFAAALGQQPKQRHFAHCHSERCSEKLLYI